MPGSILGNVPLGNLLLDTDVSGESNWQPIYVVGINRKKNRVALTQQYDKQFNLANLPVPDLSWQSIYPNQHAKKKLRAANTLSYTNSFVQPAPAVVPDLSWDAKYPNIIRGKRLRTALIPFETKRNFVPITNPVPTFFNSQIILPFRRKRFNGPYPSLALIPFYTDTPIPFNANRKLLAIVNESESWDTHFSSRGWADIAAQIAAGYPYYCQPTLTSGSYEEVYDTGVIINNTVITLQYSTAVGVGVVNVVTKIAVSDDNITYTPFNTGSTYFAASVRYVKFRFEFTTTGDINFATYFNINLNLSTKREMDGGTVDVLAADVGGTPVLFNKAFKDIETITVTPLATVEEVAIYDFVDIPNPTTFKILLYNTAGARIDGRVSWKARGVV